MSTEKSPSTTCLMIKKKYITCLFMFIYEFLCYVLFNHINIANKNKIYSVKEIA